MTKNQAAWTTSILFVLLGLCLEFWLIPVGINVPAGLPNIAQSPAFWPRIIGFLLLGLGLLLCAQTIRDGPESVNTADPGDQSGQGISWMRGFAAIALLIPYYLACTWIGLVLPSIAALFVYMALGGMHRVTPLILLAVGLPIGLALFFIHVANLLIPTGPLNGIL